MSTRTGLANATEEIRVVRLPQNVLMATHPSAIFPPLKRIGG